MADIVLIGDGAQRDRLDRLHQAIEARGWVIERLAPIGSQRDWLKHARPRLSAASCVIAVWTAASARDRWTAVGAEMALEQRTLISLVMDPVELPRAFHSVDPVDIVGWAGDSKSPLLDVLDSALRVMLHPAPRGRPTAPRPMRSAVSAGPSAARSVVALHPAPGRNAAVIERLEPIRRPAERPIAAYAPAGGMSGDVLFDGLSPLQPRVTRSAPDPDEPKPKPKPKPKSAAVSQPGLRVGLVPCVLGWAMAWVIGLTAMGIYLLSGLDGATASRIAIDNPLFSAVSGAAVGLIGAGFMVYALLMRRVRMSSSQLGLVLFGWSFGGGCGLLAAAQFGLPVVGRLYGVIGFDLGWVVAWVIAGAMGSVFTWCALRRSNPVLAPVQLVVSAGGFTLGALGGAILGWLVVALPVLGWGWLLGDPVAAAPTAASRAGLLPQLLSLGLIGAVAGAVYGAGGALVNFSASKRRGVSRDGSA